MHLLNVLFLMCPETNVIADTLNCRNGPLLWQQDRLPDCSFLSVRRFSCDPYLMDSFKKNKPHRCPNCGMREFSSWLYASAGYQACCDL
jgi:hypothetical protein